MKHADSIQHMCDKHYKLNLELNCRLRKDQHKNESLKFIIIIVICTKVEGQTVFHSQSYRKYNIQSL